MDVIFINHKKSQCGVYEIGKRIYELLDKTIIPIKYFETSIDGLNEFLSILELEKPKFIIYNYFSTTLKYINKNLFNRFSNIKHIAIIHDPLSPRDIEFYNNTFDGWIIHDDTNPIQSPKKFTTIRPIRRFERKETSNDGVVKVGTHGFNCSPWKMYDTIIDLVQKEFDEVIINFNITYATFGGNKNFNYFDEWRKKIKKNKVQLNLTSEYMETENDLINFLSKNDLNIYFYNPPHQFVGVGGSADLALSSQSGLVVNSSYMYRHFHQHIGYYEQFNNFNHFIKNKEKISNLYDLWSPNKMTNDYKKMLESI
jgi:hypothetical protein